MSKRRLEGKVAIITGAASGIGEAAARIFTAQGALVVIADIQDELGASVVASIGPDKCKYKHCDVRNEKEVEELVDFAIEAYGRLDVMYSNAGISEKLTSTILDLDFDVLDNVIGVNLHGAAATIKHAARAMVARGTRGSIICTASLAATMGGSGPAAYTASKHGVLGLVRAAAGELGRHGIRVNCVSPAAVVTPMALSLSGLSEIQAEEVNRGMMPLKGGSLKASDIGEGALFLASDESAFVTGHDLLVDGGITATGTPISLPHHQIESLRLDARSSAEYNTA